MKAREWTLGCPQRGGTTLVLTGPPMLFEDKCAVREVLPDTVMITREELRNAVERCTNAQSNLSTDKQWSQLERELFDRPLAPNEEGSTDEPK